MNVVLWIGVAGFIYLALPYKGSIVAVAWRRWRVRRTHAERVAAGALVFAQRHPAYPRWGYDRIHKVLDLCYTKRGCVQLDDLCRLLEESVPTSEFVRAAWVDLVTRINLEMKK